METYQLFSLNSRKQKSLKHNYKHQPHFACNGLEIISLVQRYNRWHVGTDHNRKSENKKERGLFDLFPMGFSCKYRHVSKCTKRPKVEEPSPDGKFTLRNSYQRERRTWSKLDSLCKNLNIWQCKGNIKKTTQQININLCWPCLVRLHHVIIHRG